MVGIVHMFSARCRVFTVLGASAATVAAASVFNSRTKKLKCGEESERTIQNFNEKVDRERDRQMREMDG